MDNKKIIPPGLTYLADNIISKDNVLGASKDAGASWAKDLALPEQGDTIFFAGCGYQFSHDLESMMGLIRKMDRSVVGSELPMNIVSFQKKLGIDTAGIFRKIMTRGGETEAQPLRDAVKVLRRLGMNPAYMARNEPCCGGLLHYIGLEEEFKQHAHQVYSTLKSSGARQIVGLVPSCTCSLKKLLPGIVPEYDLHVKHFCEVVAENINSLKLHFPGTVKVTYHDPCQLVRYLGLVDEPRKILKAIAGVELVEPKWTRGEFATCCGGGGGFEAVFPEMSEILAVNRARELVETGAQIIVTHCPGCVMYFFRL
ncbi:MAG: (Fe-S)-binding protein [Chloroflexi bacterium]|nr:(Fe-S)-binding protein [Chloroflexota bacterium]